MKDCALVWLDPAKAAVVGLRYDGAGLVKHPELPGARWLNRTKKRTGFYSRSTGGSRWNRGDLFFLPNMDVWRRYQERQQEDA